MLLFNRYRGSVEISAQQFPKLAYACKLRRVDKESFHEKAFDISINATIRILFVFGRILVLIIRIRPSSKLPLFGTALLIFAKM